MASSKVLIGPGFYITYIIPGPGTLDIVFGFNLVFEGVSQGGQQDACFDGVEGTNTTDCNDGQGSSKFSFETLILDESSSSIRL